MFLHGVLECVFCFHLNTVDEEAKPGRIRRACSLSDLANPPNRQRMHANPVPGITSLDIGLMVSYNLNHSVFDTNYYGEVMLKHQVVIAIQLFCV